MMALPSPLTPSAIHMEQAQHTEKEADQRLPVYAPSQNHRARRVETDDAASILAKTDAEHGNLHDSFLQFKPPAKLQRRVEGRAVP